MRIPDFRIVAALALLLLPAGAAAHEELRAARPAEGDELAAAPERLRLTFVNPVELSLAHLTLVGPDGTVELGELRRAPDAAHVLVGPIRGPLVAGTYTVRWQVAGPDGHPVRGEYTFTILPDAEGLAPPPVEPEAVGRREPPAPAAAEDAFPESGFDSGSPLYALVRWLTFVGLLGVIGVVAFRLFVLSFLARAGTLPDETTMPGTASRRAVRIGLGAVALLAVALVFRLYAQLYALHGAARALDPDRIAALLGGTTWGLGWWLQAGGIVVAGLGLFLARHHRAGWGLAALGVIALAFTPALSGHAAGAQDLAWLAVLADGLPAALRQDRDGGAAAAALFNAFSPTALLFAGVVVATGVASAWLHVGTWSALWTTGYGRTLLIKLAVFSLVLGTGAYNWLRVKPALGEAAAAGRLRRSATIELGIALLVLAITAVLVATPLPGETSSP